MHLYKTQDLRCLEITHEEREVRNHSRQEEDIENGVIQTMEERKYVVVMKGTTVVYALTAFWGLCVQRHTLGVFVYA